MKTRLFILTNSKIPFGNANSNYIRLFARAVVEAGWEVIVLGCGKNSKDDLHADGRYIHEGFEYNNVEFKEHIIPFSLAGHLFFGNALYRHMSQYGVTENDYIYIYSAYWNLFDKIKRAYPKLHERGHLIADCVEWFQPWQYKFGKINPEYQFWKYNFKHCITKYKKVIPISRKLQSYFQQNGCKTLIVPPMIDADSASLNMTRENSDVLNFMYSGAATNKDSIDIMLESLVQLPEKDRNRIRLHFTTLKEDTIKSILGSKCNILNELKNNLVFHGWLTYSQLLELYKKIDFLVIFRNENIVTLSNFPSKVPEMMNYGIVPVCSEVGDYTGVYLTDGTDSIFVRECNANAGAEAFSRVLGLSVHDIEEMKTNARKCAVEKFDYRRWSKMIVSFLKE